MECSLLPGCKPEDKQECEIKDVIVTVQVNVYFAADPEWS